jgi:hypothetical protein
LKDFYISGLERNFNYKPHHILQEVTVFLFFCIISIILYYNLQLELLGPNLSPHWGFSVVPWKTSNNENRSSYETVPSGSAANAVETSDIELSKTGRKIAPQ